LEKYILHDTCYANKPGLVQESIDSRLGLIKKIVMIKILMMMVAIIIIIIIIMIVSMVGVIIIIVIIVNNNDNHKTYTEMINK
jgi:hypothetical protein